MDRKGFLRSLAVLTVLPVSCTELSTEKKSNFQRVRPGDPGWPSKEKWEALKRQVQGRLTKIESPFKVCKLNETANACADLFDKINNPYYTSHNPALTQTLGWADAWTSASSAYAIEAEKTSDVVAGVNFAREHNLRLVIKGGAHSYQGRSNAKDSLLIWTRPMNEVILHDAFIPKGCDENLAPQPAVSIGAGAIWMDAYDAVTTQGGRYVQGGGCTTVGVAGLIQSGGFGSFSKKFGLACAGLLEAEVVTADGEVRIANACKNTDLFWALKGGGGGSFGVVTRVTLKTHDLPDHFGGVFGSIKASSDKVFYRLIKQLLQFYRDELLNPHWGEQIRFRTDRTVGLQMVFQGLSQTEAREVWEPMANWVDNEEGIHWEQPLQAIAIPARHFWDAEYLQQHFPDLIVMDDRPEADSKSFLWAGDQAQAGQFIHGYRSVWLPESLLMKDQLEAFANTLAKSAKYWEVSLHVNKGLAGTTENEKAAAKDTAMNPAVTEAFALAMISGEESRVFPGIPDHEPDVESAGESTIYINKAMDELLKLVPKPGSYLSESDYFEKDWKQSFWGDNYSRLKEVKKKYDPDGLFYIHHGVGSDEWSKDGFRKNITK